MNMNQTEYVHQLTDQVLSSVFEITQIAPSAFNEHIDQLVWKAIEILSTPLLAPSQGIAGDHIMNSYLTSQLKLLYRALTALFRL